MNARDAIAQRRAEFVSAFNREDLAGLARVCADDIVLMPPNQPPMHGVAQALQWWAVGFDAGRTMLATTPLELYVTDGWATEWFDWTVTLVPLRGTVPVVDTGSTVAIWRLRQGAWQLLRTMWRSHTDTPSVWAGGLAYFADDSPLLM